MKTLIARPKVPDQIADLNTVAVNVIRRIARGEKVQTERTTWSSQSTKTGYHQLQARGLIVSTPTPKGLKSTITLTPAGLNLVPFIREYDAAINRWSNKESAEQARVEAIERAALDLYEALKPFAAMAAHLDSRAKPKTDDEVLVSYESVGSSAAITAGDCRRAGAAIKKAEGQADG